MLAYIKCAGILINICIYMSTGIYVRNQFLYGNCIFQMPSHSVYTLYPVLMLNLRLMPAVDLDQHFLYSPCPSRGYQIMNKAYLSSNQPTRTTSKDIVSSSVCGVCTLIFQIREKSLGVVHCLLVGHLKPVDPAIIWILNLLASTNTFV